MHHANHFAAMEVHFRVYIIDIHTALYTVYTLKSYYITFCHMRLHVFPFPNLNAVCFIFINILKLNGNCADKLKKIITNDSKYSYKTQY